MAGHNNYFNGLIQVRTQYIPAGDDRDTPENVLWWKGGFSTGLTEAQIEEIQLAFDPAWGSMWASIGATAVNYSGSIVTDWSSDTGISVDSVGSASEVPGTKGNSQPSQVAALLSLSVAQRFKGGHGRIYLPNVGVSACTGNMDLNSTALTDLEEGWTAVVTAMQGVSAPNGGPFNPYLFRYRNANYPLDAAPVPQILPILSANPASLLATQRRRLRKVAHR